ncbi:hypothetical protein MHLP_02975 [Candidatus Mycoplasma haematolamae str. Purdue]|uniref:Uncharacterized protein n=1 Tax=Mycoplasma haematolamae (strain Purdue) TaxID=1212765 RepID=I7BA61_MYCHA|nr:hypothetical protein MHLP_02975 [Candidatus Mycoplasma haematolamae str. Purdue]
MSAGGYGIYDLTEGRHSRLEKRVKEHQSDHTESRVDQCKGDVCDHMFSCSQTSSNGRLPCGHICLKDINLYADFVNEDERKLIAERDQSTMNIHTGKCPEQPTEKDFLKNTYQGGLVLLIKCQSDLSR